jgi:hypothetical protein
MKNALLCLLLLWSSLALSQTKNCTSRQDGPNRTTVTCDDSTSATVTNVTPPAVQPIPLPALSVQPPQPVTINTNLMAMAMIASSNKPPSNRQLKKYCKKHPGQPWVWHNFYGVEVAKGQCQ